MVNTRSCVQPNIHGGCSGPFGTRAPSQYPKRRIFVRSRKVSKPRDWYFKLSYRFEIWQAHRQHCCRSSCQIAERSDNSKYKSRGFEILQDLTERRVFGYWDGAQDVNKHRRITMCVSLRHLICNSFGTLFPQCTASERYYIISSYLYCSRLTSLALFPQSHDCI